MNTEQRPRRYLLYASQDYSFPILFPLRDAIVKRGDRVAWFVHGDAQPDVYLDDSDELLPGVHAVQEYAPLAVITPNNTVPHFFPGIKVQVFHGFNARKRSRRGVDSHFAIRGFFDLYCTHGPGTTRVFEELGSRLGHFKVTETGWPKMDGLFRQCDRRPTDARPTVLLTSTFSRDLSGAMQLLPVVSQLIARNEMDWLVQFHPKMARSVVDTYRAIQAENYRFVDTSDVTPYLARADVMVSDTSSILQEFMQLERPVVTLRNRTPGPWLIDIQNPEDLPDAIGRALTRPPGLIEEIKRYNAELHPYADGCSSARVLEAIDDFFIPGHGVSRSRPLNLLRKFKMRKELAYWKLR